MEPVQDGRKVGMLRPFFTNPCKYAWLRFDEERMYPVVGPPLRSVKRGGAKMRTHLMSEKGTSGAGGRAPEDCFRVMFLFYSELKMGVFAIRIKGGNVEFVLAGFPEIPLPGFAGCSTDFV